MVIGIFICILMILQMKGADINSQHIKANPSDFNIGWDSSLGNSKTAFGVAYKIFGTGDIFPILIGIFISIFVSNEFSLGTIKNILSIGYKKSSFYLSKLITVSVASVAIMFSMIVVSCVIFGIGDSVGLSDILNFARMLLVQSLLHIAFASLFLMVAIIIRNNSGVMATNICLVLSASVIFVMLSTHFEFGKTLRSLWLAPNVVAMTDTNPLTYIVTRAIIVGFFYLIVSSSLGMFIFKRQDVK